HADGTRGEGVPTPIRGVPDHCGVRRAAATPDWRREPCRAGRRAGGRAPLLQWRSGRGRACRPAAITTQAVGRATLAGRRIVPEASAMRSAAITEFGGPEQLRVMDVPTPQPAADQVLIRTIAAGVGMWDSFVRRGFF